MIESKENNSKSTELIITTGIKPGSNSDKGFKAPLQLSPITINKEYRKKWNISCNDFVCLTRDGVLINELLYRIGGINHNLDVSKDNYFMLIKHVEAHYDDDITKDKDRKPHLENRWAIIDKHGVEKFESKQSTSIYLIGKTRIYHIDKKYYDAETGKKYCDSYSRMESDEFLFLDNKFDDDKSKRGVMKINKKDGTFELFPGK